MSNPDELQSLRAELESIKRSMELVRQEADSIRDLVEAKWRSYWALDERARDLRRRLARLGDGFDTDYYHRRRERLVPRFVQDGIHRTAEDPA